MAGNIATIWMELDVGFRIIMTPIKPNAIAAHLWGPIFSFRKMIDKSVMITGAIKKTAVASA